MQSHLDSFSCSNPDASSPIFQVPTRAGYQYIGCVHVPPPLSCWHLTMLQHDSSYDRGCLLAYLCKHRSRDKPVLIRQFLGFSQGSEDKGGCHGSRRGLPTRHSASVLAKKKNMRFPGRPVKSLRRFAKFGRNFQVDDKEESAFSTRGGA